MQQVCRNAYAKLNLTLDVCGKAGGYHALDSLAVTIDLSDQVVLTRRTDARVCVKMSGAGAGNIPLKSNNALLAAEKFVRTFVTDGVDISIRKAIPIGAGLGGSSADSAAVIAGMGSLFCVNMDDCKSLADSCGSDTGFLTSGGLARLGGRGEQVKKLPFVQMHFLLLLPEVGIPTPACFARYDDMGCPRGARTEEAVRHLQAGDLAAAARLFGNDLFPAACSLSAEVGEAYRELEALSPLGVSMTGSGSAVFALFPSEEGCVQARESYRGRFRTLIARSVCPQE